MERLIREIISDNYDEIIEYRHLTPKIYYQFSETLINLLKGKTSKYTIYSLIKNLDSQIDILKYTKKFDKESISLFVINYFQNRLNNIFTENSMESEAQSN
jgi:hypothetical protein